MAVVILAILAIVVSNTWSQIFPRLPLPLLQIAVGCVLALVFPHHSIALDPELFMVLIIAPLLFHESDEANLISLWRVRKPIILLAFVLVFLTVGAVGVSFHAMLPVVPLAACFALGAILGPTDAAAVSSMSSRLSISPQLSSVLQGEGLINDASGLIAFRLAVVALLSGTFSPVAGGINLIVLVLGGVLVGTVLSALESGVIKALGRRAVRTPATYVLIELVVPFLGYMIAEAVGVSGIIAVVVAGARQGSFDIGAVSAADVGTSKRAVWDILMFCLNSIVFLLLGLQLPAVVTNTWNDATYSHWFLILVILAVTLIVAAVRFGSVFVLSPSVLGERLSEKAKNALVLTLSGVKGTVSLATAFSLPLVLGDGSVFAQRGLLLFVAAGAIVLSLLAAAVIIPLISKAPTTVDDEESPILAVLQETVNRLQTPDQEDARGAVILDYNMRIVQAMYGDFSPKERRQARTVGRRAYLVEWHAIRDAWRAGNISWRMLQSSRQLLYLVYRDTLRMVTARAGVRGLWMVVGRPFHKKHGVEPGEEDIASLRALFTANADAVSQTLAQMRGRYSDKVVDWVARQRADVAQEMQANTYADSWRARWTFEYEQQMLDGYRIERETIRDFEKSGSITSEQASRLRVIVDKLELNVLMGNQSRTIAEVDGLIQNLSRNKDEDDENPASG
jgi:CPA1 family monovalent cation:H+ antiporter